MAKFNNRTQFGAQRPGGEGMSCGRAETLLMDWMDGTLSAVDKEALDLHLTHCSDCTAKLAEAERGAEWLRILKAHSPEPSSDLVARILARTTGQHLTPVMTLSSGSGNVIPFRAHGGFMQRMKATVLQPRLYMTAAMAFFSIALTLNMVGVHVTELTMADLKPTNIKRSFYRANSSAIRYYSNLKVVYELQSRVQEMKGDDTTNRDNSKPESNKKDGDKQGGGSSRRDQDLRRPVLSALLEECAPFGKAVRKEVLV